MNFKFSCVLDYNPLMAAQTYIWLANLLADKIEPKDIYIHHINFVPAEFLEYLENTGVNLIKTTAFDPRNPYCNKLVQLQTFARQEDFDYVFLMDCDTALIDLEGLELKNEVYAKVVDFSNPPLDILENLFAKHQFKVQKTGTSFEIHNYQVTDWNNCNGGLYIISKPFLKLLKPTWEKYAQWCIDNNELFGENFAKHADQVSFALAMSGLEKRVSHLGIEWNYPIHVDKNMLPEVEPHMIHFHKEIDAHMNLKKTGLQKIDKAIELVNERTSQNLSSHLSNSLFWDLRYSQCPELGSGVGSRGEILDYKKRLIKYLTYSFIEKKIIDVGCGDLELTKDFNFKNYLGLDISEESLKICRSKRPDWIFKNLSITDSSVGKADLIMCFDVLIHQSSLAVFKGIISSIVSKTQNRVIIGAYNEPAEFKSDITYYHSAILGEIKQYNEFNEVGIVGKYRDVTVLSASQYKSDHLRDISSELINRAYEEVERPDILQYLVDVSRVNFGFYTSHYSRVFEYTWLYEQLENETGNVLDLGAGVCPLPLALANNGFKVTTIDSHPTQRKLAAKKEWTEWGFLDYSIFNKAITSRNIDFLKFRSKKKFDFIYSISVIEHIPQKSRLKILKNVSRLLKKNGKLLLTIDLYPGTNNLWNLSEGIEVEPIGEHGTTYTLKKELKKFGFKVLEETVQRNIEASRTDVCYLSVNMDRKSLFSFFRQII